MYKKLKVPVIQVGRYAGRPVDHLPNSYLRWLITQDFPKDILEAALRKLNKSDYGDLYLSVSRHAIDMFSKRFLELWTSSEGQKDDGEGLATFIAKMADVAWKEGSDISKKRHKDDGIIKDYLGIQWVFNVNTNYPDYKDVITVMVSETKG